MRTVLWFSTIAPAMSAAVAAHDMAPGEPQTATTTAAGMPRR